MSARPFLIGASTIRRRVYLLMAIGIFFPLAVMAAVGLYWLQAMDDHILEARLSSAAAVAGHYDEVLTGDLEILQRLAASLSGELDAEGLPRARRALREAHARFRYRENLFLIDRSLTLLASEPPGRGGPAPDDPVVLEVLRTGVPRLSVERIRGDEARRDAGGHAPPGPLVYELVPVRGLDGRVEGLVGGSFAPAGRELGAMLRHLRHGRTGFADIVDAQGQVISSTEPSRVGARVECAGHVVRLIQARRPESARCRECHAQRRVEARAPAELMSFAPLTGAPWGVLARQATDEALPTEGALPWYGVAFVLAGQLALAGAFAWGAARSVTRPVEVLTGEAERIAGGELASPIPDLGADEVGRLGKALDRMRDSLRGLLEHVAGVNADLEHRVAERTQELAQANAQLREREEARAQLLRKVISAQEDERKRIARELHDETSQSLAVLAMGLEGAQDAIRSGRTARLDEVKAVAVRTLEDVHRIILDLRPSVLDDLGLLSAIRWYADRQLGTRGISVRCEFGELARLPPEMETALFRVCQEAMSNVARHAKASAVLVQVGVEGREIRIEIEDDGRGFDPGDAEKREDRRPWGLMGIRERAEILGGTARIESAPGQGTRVLVRIPLPAESRAKEERS